MLTFVGGRTLSGHRPHRHWEVFQRAEWWQRKSKADAPMALDTAPDGKETFFAREDPFCVHEAHGMAVFYPPFGQKNRRLRPMPPPNTQTPWTVPVVPVEAVLAQGQANVFDLRSPSEFALDHLPGATNVPLFDDVERALIGTIYAKKSPGEAFDAGRERVLERITPGAPQWH